MLLGMSAVLGQNARLLNPGVIRGFDPQPDPPGRPALGGPDTMPAAKGFIVIGG